MLIGTTRGAKPWNRRGLFFFVGAMKEEPWEGGTPSSTFSSCRWSPPFEHSEMLFLQPKPWQSNRRLFQDRGEQLPPAFPSASKKTPKSPHLTNPSLPFPSPTAAFPRGSSKMPKTCPKSRPATQTTEIKPETELINKLGAPGSQRAAQSTRRGCFISAPLASREMGAARTERNKSDFEGCCSFSALRCYWLISYTAAPCWIDNPTSSAIGHQSTWE